MTLKYKFSFLHAVMLTIMTITLSDSISCAEILVTAFDAIHDQSNPEQLLKTIYKALTPGGTFLMKDIAASSNVENNMNHPIAPFLYTISCMHCMSVSLAGGGPGLGAMWGKEKALEMLKNAGFRDVRIEQLSHDIQNYYYITLKNLQ
jgi:ubiquinone/menaquinone biosynthesis C-methylase UbiE